MIEVEKKFLLTEVNKKRLIRDAQFLHEYVFTDTYYDTQDFSLTGTDIWLRSREDRYELKVPMQEAGARATDQYEEMEEESAIRTFLNLPSDGTLAEVLASNGYKPFCTCKTTRRKYQKSPFIIDLDVVDFDHFVYTIGEIELMVSRKSEIEGAVEKIIAFAKENQLTMAPVRGKVIEYLKRERPEHYHYLTQAGIVQDIDA